jgi:hypothetical protein
MDRSCLETGSTETFARSVNAAALAEPSSWSGSSPALAHHRRASRDGKGAAHPGKHTGPVAALRATAAIAAYRLKSIIDQTFEMDNAPKAYAHLAGGWTTLR